MGNRRSSRFASKEQQHEDNTGSCGGDASPATSVKKPGPSRFGAPMQQAVQELLLTTVSSNKFLSPALQPIKKTSKKTHSSLTVKEALPNGRDAHQDVATESKGLPDTPLPAARRSTRSRTLEEDLTNNLVTSVMKREPSPPIMVPSVDVKEEPGPSLPGPSDPPSDTLRSPLVEPMNGDAEVSDDGIQEEEEDTPFDNVICYGKFKKRFPSQPDADDTLFKKSNSFDLGTAEATQPELPADAGVLAKHEGEQQPSEPKEEEHGPQTVDDENPLLKEQADGNEEEHKRENEEGEDNESEGMDMQVADEFVDTDIPESPSTVLWLSDNEMDNIQPEDNCTEDNKPVPKQVKAKKKGVTKDRNATETEVTVTVTKSGRKVNKPKMTNFVVNDPFSNDTDTSESEGKVLSEEELQELAKKYPSVYEPGDLIWARLGLSPFWPASVTKDPFLNVHTAIKMKAKTSFRQYHVQFFGRVQRAWVRSSHIMTFEGIDAFFQKANQAKEAPKNSSIRKQGSKLFQVNHSNTKLWDDAVKSLMSLVDMERENRLDFLKTQFDSQMGKRSDKLTGRVKRKRIASGSTVSSVSTAKRPKVLQDIEEKIKSISPKVLEENRRKLKTGFKLFQLANMSNSYDVETAMSTDPAPSSQEASDRLQNEYKAWYKLSMSERRFYQNSALRLSKSEMHTNGADTEDTNLESDVSGMDCEEDSDEEEQVDESTEDDDSSSKESDQHKMQSKHAASRTCRTDMMLYKKELCCIICEKVSRRPGDLLKCKGGCQNAYHSDCLPKDEPCPIKTDGEESAAIVEESSQVKADLWKCPECTTGRHSCLICKGTQDEVVRCSSNGCGKFFHRACLKSGMWPQSRFSETQLTCPAHMCHTCASDNPQDPFMKYNSRLLKCLRCPTAYHAEDFCIAAGSVHVTATHIICPKHYQPAKNKKSVSMHHINVSWCFFCSKGGSLICCELCPASFHAECLKIDPPEGLYHCDSCESGKLPLYGEVLWVKLGHYRWWPARVLFPSEVPNNINRLSHDVGEFPIQFTGSNEYYWINAGRCFPFEEGDSNKIPKIGGNSKVKITSRDVSYRKGILVAAEALHKYNAEKLRREAANAEKVRTQRQVKPPLYSKIQVNKPFGDCPVYTSDPKNYHMCDCDPSSDDPCGKNTDCINRLLLMECQPSKCSAGDRCQNMQFQRRIYPKLVVMKTASRGWGLFVLEDIKKGDFIIEYVGELITMDEFRVRMDRTLNSKDADQNYYYMVMDSNRMIDAGPKGNIARFMNHSCNPNCETQKWQVNGDTRVGLFALEDISAGTELTFNYQFEAVDEVKKPCLCGAKNCSGYIGVKVTKEKVPGHLSNMSSSVAKKKKGKKAKALVKKVWEDHCFRCFDSGELLMCDWKTCPKVYHLSCLQRDKMPREKWFCPWHHCVNCGKLAVKHCIHCPNAYCKSHDEVIKLHPELGLICDEHQDDIADLLKFYHQIGGISGLVQHPDMPLVPPSTESINPSSRLTITELGKDEDGDDEDSAEDDRNEQDEGKAESQTKHSSFKSSLLACRFCDDFKVTLASDLMAHFVDYHRLSQSQSDLQTKRCIRKIKMHGKDSSSQTNSDPTSSSVVSTSSSSSRHEEKLYTCPVCQRGVRPASFKRHLQFRHPNSARHHSLMRTNRIFTKKIEKKSISRVNRMTTGICTRASSHGDQDRFICSAPNCGRVLSKTYERRHWKRHHAMLCSWKEFSAKYNTDYIDAESKAKQHLSTSKSRFRQAASSGRDGTVLLRKRRLSLASSSTTRCLDQGSPKPRRISMESYSNSQTASLSMHNQSLMQSDEKIKWFICDFNGCTYESRYNSNMRRHRYKYKHWFKDEDDTNASHVLYRDASAPAPNYSNKGSTSMLGSIVANAKDSNQQPSEELPSVSATSTEEQATPANPADNEINEEKQQESNSNVAPKSPEVEPKSVEDELVPVEVKREEEPTLADAKIESDSVINGHVEPLSGAATEDKSQCAQPSSP